MPALRLELLEPRDTPAAVTEAGVNDSFTLYQPLNGDETYTVSGRVSALTDVDYYAFAVAPGAALEINVRASWRTGFVHTEFDPTVGLFAPDGTLVSAADGGGGGSLGAAGLLLKADQPGTWRVAVSHHGDLTFDGTSPVIPSWNPKLPATTGPGLHTGGYVLTVAGAQKPQLVVRPPADGTAHRIDPDAPRMPTLTAELLGLTPVPGQPVDYTWQTRVEYRAADYPAVPGQFGPGKDIPSPAYDAHTVRDAAQFTPDFAAAGAAPVRGGRLLLTVTAKVGGKTYRLATPATGPDAVRILGANPDPAVVSAHVAGLPAPAGWPADGPSYATTVRQIIAQESAVAQFGPAGSPLWSRDGLRGVGMMQLTNPAPTPDQVWDWRSNVAGGVKLLEEKLAIATDRLTKLAAAVRAEAPPDVLVAPVSGEMLVRETLRAYNGLNNGTGVKDEYRPARGPDGKLALSQLPSGQRTTAWEPVPVAVRGTTIGDPDYVRHVLDRPDY